MDLSGFGRGVAGAVNSFQQPFRDADFERRKRSLQEEGVLLSTLLEQNQRLQGAQNQQQLEMLLKIAEGTAGISQSGLDREAGRTANLENNRTTNLNLRDDNTASNTIAVAGALTGNQGALEKVRSGLKINEGEKETDNTIRLTNNQFSQLGGLVGALGNEARASQSAWVGPGGLADRFLAQDARKYDQGVALAQRLIEAQQPKGVDKTIRSFGRAVDAAAPLTDLIASFAAVRSLADTNAKTPPLGAYI